MPSSLAKASSKATRFSRRSASTMVRAVMASLLDPAGCAAALQLAGPAVGIYHALATSFIAELRPFLLEVGLPATIGQPHSAGALLLRPLPVRLFLFLGLLFLLFSVCLVIFEGVAF